MGLFFSFGIGGFVFAGKPERKEGAVVVHPHVGEGERLRLRLRLGGGGGI